MTTQTIFRSITLVLLAAIAGLLGFLLYDSLTHTEAYLGSDVDDVTEPLDDVDVATNPIEEEGDTVENEMMFVDESVLSLTATVGGITFGNGTGMQIVDDAIVTLHSAGPTLLVTRHVFIDGEVVQEEVELYSEGSWVSPAALSESNNTLIAMFNTRDGFFVSFSYDGGVSWEASEWITDAPVGAAVPTSCLWHEGDELNAMLAWVAPEHQGDGGPLHVATLVDDVWGIERVSDYPYISSPSLDCDADQQSMIIRVEESIEKTGDIDVYFLKREDGEWQEPQYIMRGADPHLAVCDGDYWVGYHDVGANLLHSDDGGETWESKVLSDTGKFGSIACDGDTVVVSWGQWPSLKDANSKAQTRGVGAQVSFDGGETWEEWKPAGDAQGQQISVTDVKNGIVSIFWRTAESLILKTY
ncbi:MAG: sialidase family protein [bacterium]|jgi:hypothetical protein|nr:sialidase family protein [bacterium]